MRVTQVLYGPPIFRHWKEFGAGKDLKKRQKYFIQWQYIWNAFIRRMKIADKTLPVDKLPPGARVLDAEDFLCGHIDDMPEKLMRIKSGEKVIYDHPWPYNVRLDTVTKQEPIHYYTIDTRFFFPSQDIQNLTNTIIETDSMEAQPPIEPQAQDIDQIQNKIHWAVAKDSVLVRLPKKREFPKINIKPKAEYGITDERAETHVLKSLAHHSQAILSHHKFHNGGQFNEYLKLSSLSFPHCRVLLERESQKIGFDLCIDHMTLGRDPLPVINSSPEDTKSKELANIRPRTWKSIIEKTRFYNNDWSFKFPSGAHPRTIYLAARIKRELPDEEMLSRNIMHAYGLTSQLARMRQQELPITLQVISYKLMPKRTFFFTRFQLNTLDFGNIKNQAWHSGPIEDVSAAFRYFLDFENIDREESRKQIASID